MVAVFPSAKRSNSLHSSFSNPARPKSNEIRLCCKTFQRKNKLGNHDRELDVKRVPILSVSMRMPYAH